MKRSILTVLLLCFVVMIAGAQAPNRTWNFDTDIDGSIGKGFSNDAGEWKVTGDASAPSKRNVLGQFAKSSGSEFNVTLVTDTNYKEVDLSVKMKAVAGKSDQGGGLVWRAKDGKNYYIARYNPLEDNYRVYKVVNGRRSSEFQNANIRHADGWHTLRVTMSGDHIECYYDGKKSLDVHDSTFTNPGKIGLWSKADAQSYFDDLNVSGQ